MQILFIVNFTRVLKDPFLIKLPQNYIGEVFSSLTKESHDMINLLSKSGVEPKATTIMPKEEDLFLLYGEEACEIGAILLADRYFLERVCQAKKKATSWFDYAVFYLKTGDEEKAFECVRRSLLENEKFKYSLLMFALLLCGRNKKEEAETCFLTAMFFHPTWLEGWVTMHLFYSHIGNSEGADLCLEMAHKYMNTPKSNDYFTNRDNLIWTTSICPNELFFRTAALLIKMYFFEFAEKSLTHTKNGNRGVYHYLLGVIQYYRKNYEHALVHAKEAEQLHGPDYAVNALAGHCYLALDKLADAKNEYMGVLESFDRPDDIHLVFVYLALISERTGDKQFAKKMLLSACKYSPTPYTWLGVGLIYYSQKDLISAEQCLLQANVCDNRLPEVWGYLALINLELARYSEAELCYKQTKKNKIVNEELVKKIEKAWTWVNKTLY